MVAIVVLVRHQIVGIDLLLLGVLRRRNLRTEFLVFLACAGKLRAHKAAKAFTVGDDVAAEAFICVDHKRADTRIGEACCFWKVAERKCCHRGNLAILIQAQGGSRGLHPCTKFPECTRDFRKVRRIQFGDENIRRKPSDEAYLFCRDGTKAEDSTDECLKEFAVHIGLYACDNIVNIRRKEVIFVLHGREGIRDALKDGAHTARVLADAAQRLGDDTVLVQDDVAVFADEFEGERARDDAPAACDYVNVEVDDAIAALLPHGGNASRLKLFAQEHDEGRRFGRILRCALDEMCGWVACVCIDVEEAVLSRLTHGEDDGLFIRLVDFVDASARECVREFACEGGHGEAVKAHGITSF